MPLNLQNLDVFILVKDDLIFPEETQHKTSDQALFLVDNHSYDCSISIGSIILCVITSYCCPK